MQEQGVDLLLTVKAHQRTLLRQITRPFDGTRQIIFLATDHELGLGRDITWTLRAKESPQQRVRDRWSVEGWHWIRDTQLHEDAHRYRGNGAGAMATLRTAALNLLRLAGFQSIRSGMQAVMHDITALLAMARRPQPNPC